MSKLDIFIRVTIIVEMMVPGAERGGEGFQPEK